MHPWTTPFFLIGFTGAALGFGGSAKAAVMVAEVLFAVSATLLLVVSLLNGLRRLRQRWARRAWRPSGNAAGEGMSAPGNATLEDAAFYAFHGHPRDLAGMPGMPVMRDRMPDFPPCPRVS